MTKLKVAMPNWPMCLLFFLQSGSKLASYTKAHLLSQGQIQFIPKALCVHKGMVPLFQTFIFVFQGCVALPDYFLISLWSKTHWTPEANATCGYLMIQVQDDIHFLRCNIKRLRVG